MKGAKEKHKKITVYFSDRLDDFTRYWCYKKRMSFIELLEEFLKIKNRPLLHKREVLNLRFETGKRRVLVLTSEKQKKLIEDILKEMQKRYGKIFEEHQRKLSKSTAMKLLIREAEKVLGGERNE
ncbi:hypothetical protein [Aquifex sp.]